MVRTVGEGGGVVTWATSLTSNSDVISVLYPPSNVAASTKTTSSAVSVSLFIWVLIVVSVPPVPVPIFLSSIGSLVADYIEVYLSWWVVGGPAIPDEYDDIIPYLSLQRRV